MVKNDGFVVADCHLHGPGPDGTTGQWHVIHKTYREYLRYLAKTGVSSGVQNSIAAVKARTAGELDAANDYALALARRSKHVPIMPACILHPRLLSYAPATLTKFRRAGSCWAGEMCPYIAGYEISDRDLLKMARLLDAEGFVMQIHSCPAEQLEPLAAECPSLPLVVSHLGDYRAVIIGQIELARRYSNVYLDICGSGHERLGMIEKAVSCGLGKRILYGSDFPVNEPGGPMIRIINSDLPKTVKADILSRNLFRLVSERGGRIG